MQATVAVAEAEVAETQVEEAKQEPDAHVEAQVDVEPEAEAQARADAEDAPGLGSCLLKSEEVFWSSLRVRSSKTSKLPRRVACEKGSQSVDRSHHQCVGTSRDPKVQAKEEAKAEPKEMKFLL